MDDMLSNDSAMPSFPVRNQRLNPNGHSYPYHPQGRMYGMTRGFNWPETKTEDFVIYLSDDEGEIEGDEL